MPPEDDPIIRGLREAGIRPLRPIRTRRDSTAARSAILLIAIVLAFLVFLPFLAGRLADWLWYREIGFERVFLTKVVAQWALGVPTALLAFGVLYANARVAMSGEPRPTRPPVTRMRGSLEMREAARALIGRGMEWFVLPATAVLSIVFGLAAASQWRTLLQAVYGTPFGVADPVFGRDVGYYVFTLPAIELVTGMLFGLLLLSLLAVVLPIHVFRGEILGSPRGVSIGPRAQTQLAVLAGLLLLLTAVRIHFVRIPGLLFGNHLPLTGANYVDLHTRLPALHVLSVVAFAGALLILWGGARGRLVAMAARVVVGYVVVWVLATLIPAAYQRLVVQPNELARETPQILDHIRATRQAWGLEGIEDHELTTDTRLTPALIASNRATVDNVRLWDREPLLQTFGQIQSIRTYYDFVAVDDDRYHVAGQLRQVLLSAREMNTASLPTRGFINEHLTYTHGMGVTLGPSNAVTTEGLPLLFIKDLPPVSSIDLRVARPQIYFGELSNDFVLAPSRQREFDYPAGEGDAAAYSSYDGRAGVPVGSFARRLLYAIRFGSLNILLSDDLTDRTRILYYRDVRERAERALPFLSFDRDPYLVITSDGRLVWMLDAYTTSARYPYAKATQDGTNYMRNSVKVTIDAYDGVVRAYLAAPSDPIIRTLARIYPGLLLPLDAMPTDLRSHLRYPEDLFGLQTALFATYHMADPETFYHREDQWQIPDVPSATTDSEGRPRGQAFLRHMVMRLPGERDAEFILMRPLTPRQKDNLAAWMVARNDGPHYGKLAVYRFPRQSLVFGPNQIVNRINQDTEVSRQITLWDQRGSQVLRGELLVLPIEGALIYVQPLYLRAQGGRIPELKRVVVAHEGRVAMAETLDGALAALLSGGGVAAPAQVPDTSARTDTTAEAALGTTPGATGAVPERIAQLA
ncbi:MAG: UPF0182 family protein, partial [Gemmatimonadetes bacterium]|nr:UPF0182 family protein [Gemmatimonadota bacterium]